MTQSKGIKVSFLLLSYHLRESLYSTLAGSIFKPPHMIAMDGASVGIVVRWRSPMVACNKDIESSVDQFMFGYF